MAYFPARITEWACGCCVTSFDKKFSAGNAGTEKLSTRKHGEEGAGHDGRVAIASDMLMDTGYPVMRACHCQRHTCERGPAAP